MTRYGEPLRNDENTDRKEECEPSIMTVPASRGRKKEAKPGEKESRKRKTNAMNYKQRRLR